MKLQVLGDGSLFYCLSTVSAHSTYREARTRCENGAEVWRTAGMAHRCADVDTRTSSTGTGAIPSNLGMVRVELDESAPQVELEEPGPLLPCLTREEVEAARGILTKLKAMDMSAWYKFPQEQRAAESNCLGATARRRDPDATEALDGYLHFLALKVVRKDWDAKLLSAPPPVDGIWHKHLMHTSSYRQTCEAVAPGCFIDHDPNGAREQEYESRTLRRRQAIFDYCTAFGELAWPGGPLRPAPDTLAGRMWNHKTAGRLAVRLDEQATAPYDMIRVRVVALGDGQRGPRSVESQRSVTTVVNMKRTDLLRDLLAVANVHWRHKYICVPFCCCLYNQGDSTSCPCCPCGACIPLFWRREAAGREQGSCSAPQYELRVIYLGGQELKVDDDGHRTLEDCGVEDLSTVHVALVAEPGGGGGAGC